MRMTLVLAHAGEGATWQALLTLLSLGLVVVFVLVLVGRLRMQQADDLVLPLAGVAILAALSGAVSNTLSDWVGWAFPIGVVLLIALVLAAITNLSIGWTTPLTIGAVVVAAVAATTLYTPIIRAWHPVTFASSDSIGVTIIEPSDGDTVTAGTVEVVVTIFGDWQIGGPNASGDQLGAMRIFLDGFETERVDPIENCTAGCSVATFPVQIDEPGEVRVQAEFVALDGTQFVSTTFDSVTLTVEAD